MAEKRSSHIRIDLDQFELHIAIKNKIELTLLFDSPSRRFYLSLIALVITRMKEQSRIGFVHLQKHHELIALLNTTVGAAAGSSEKVNLLTRVYRKWKDALPNLEEAPLFKIVGRKKEHIDGVRKTYQLTETEKDIWANLFEYKGSRENVRLKFSIDRLEIGLEEVALEFQGYLNAEAWANFISRLREKPGLEAELKPDTAVPEPDKSTATGGIGWTGWLRPYRLAIVIVLIGFISGLAALILLKTDWRLQKSENASTGKTTFPLPETPSIAVLPFVNMSADPGQEYLADGITEEIITALARVPKLLVIARNSTFTYKGKPIKVQKVGEDLGVRYVLEGSINNTGGQVRITVQLTDALSGHQLWAERYNQSFYKIFAMQDDITIRILNALRVKLTEGEGARGLTKGTKNLDAYLKILQAYEKRNTFNKESQARARQLAEEAIVLDPGYALAYSHLAAALGNEVALGVYDNPRKVLKRAYELAEKAVDLDDSLA